MIAASQDNSPGIHAQRGRMIALWAYCLVLACGCRGVHSWKHEPAPAADDAACATHPIAIKRRIYVITRGPVGVVGAPQGFGVEVVAALNVLPSCNAILVPPDTPIDPPQAPPGSLPPSLMMIDGPSPTSEIDEILVITVTEMLPFRPMRLSAVIERRLASDNLIISREHRTWNAPVDEDPPGPNPLNRFMLNHPPPPGVIQQHELSRLSPRAFYRNVAVDIGQGFASGPI
jgi:hypothetical protein